MRKAATQAECQGQETEANALTVAGMSIKNPLLVVGVTTALTVATTMDERAYRFQISASGNLKRHSAAKRRQRHASHAAAGLAATLRVTLASYYPH